MLWLTGYAGDEFLKIFEICHKKELKKFQRWFLLSL